MKIAIPTMSDYTDELFCEKMLSDIERIVINLDYDSTSDLIQYRDILWSMLFFVDGKTHDRGMQIYEMLNRELRIATSLSEKVSDHGHFVHRETKEDYNITTAKEDSFFMNKGKIIIPKKEEVKIPSYSNKGITTISRNVLARQKGTTEETLEGRVSVFRRK